MANSGNSFPKAAAHLISFDGGACLDTSVQRPDRYRYWDDLAGGAEPIIPRGGGYSYAAASFLPPRFQSTMEASTVP